MCKDQYWSLGRSCWRAVTCVHAGGGEAARGWDWQSQSADASRLGADWCVRTCEQVDALAEAWRSHDAWEGMTQAGGVDMPAEVTGRVALNELIIHGSDIARASGQQYQPDTQSLQESLQLVAAAQQEDPRKEGLFGPPVPIADDAPLLDRFIALSGRDPGWAPPNGQR